MAMDADAARDIACARTLRCHAGMALEPSAKESGSVFRSEGEGHVALALAEVVRWTRALPGKIA